MKKMKKTGIVTASALLAFSLAGPVAATEHGRKSVKVEFKDTQNMEWAAENIGRMKVKGIFQGDEEGLFQPNKPVTRIQSIITAVRLLDLEEEAKSRTNVELPFKDASSVNERVRGYISVALEQKLIDSTSENFLPNKPAERLWISSLLVRTLGLQDEAAQSKNEPLDFKDAKQIPKNFIGDVFIANEYGIFAGNTAGLFQPNKPITRAQMAAVLDRTYGQLLEENGASTVNGVVTDVSVNNDTKTGSLTVKTFNGELLTYQIPVNLLVQYHNLFMSADQILVGDNIELSINNNIILEIALFEKASDIELNTGIQKLKLELQFKNATEVKLKYKSNRGKTKVEMKVESETGKIKYKDEEAIKRLEEYLAKWNISPEMTKEEIKDGILATFNSLDLEEIKMEVKFSNGTKLAMEDGYGSDDDMENDDDNKKRYAKKQH
ncbi:S-layer homology domain-containing protein [Domibacillus mangrovi]|uniref:SLH domain-containing protein n=1 Tax=Domibacillus mangrovi TaxID=1714354 RepID=A0A1Q5P3N6_9BACI|nr:S-layer homology domain-containing protein [Domibacillus mangrovi]OKL36857.1 hypothetical protein BLL40_09045 [Domibacillus mangrovi]